MKIENTVALVTGASRGLGRALMHALAARGARVVGVARGREALDAAVAEVRRSGGQAWGIADDVGAPDAAARIAGQAAALAGGPVDLLVHNASTLGAVPLPPMQDMASDAVARTFEVNVLGPLRLNRALVGGMVLRGRGTVVSVSSDAAVEAYPTWGAYGASKAALDHLVRVQAAELDGTGVRLFAVDPGEMDTAMHADAIPDADPSTLRDPAEVAARIVSLVLDGSAAPSGARVAA